VIPLHGQRAAVSLTVAHYCLPKGRIIHKTRQNAHTGDWGVTPDVIVDITPQELEAIGARRRELDQLPLTPTTAPATQRVATSAAAKPLEILIDAQVRAALEWVRTRIQVPGIDEAQYPTGHQAGAHNGIAD
jgi:hypothetical protein